MGVILLILLRALLLAVSGSRCTQCKLWLSSCSFRGSSGSVLPGAGHLVDMS